MEEQVISSTVLVDRKRKLEDELATGHRLLTEQQEGVNRTLQAIQNISGAIAILAELLDPAVTEPVPQEEE